MIGQLDIQRKDKTFTVKHGSGTKVWAQPNHSSNADYSAHRFTSDWIDAQINTHTEYSTESAEVQVVDIEAEVTNDGLFSFFIRGEYTWKQEAAVKVAE